MAQVLNRRGRVQLRLDTNEREALLHVVGTLTPLVGQTLNGGQRAYESDAEQAEFDRWVRPDIERGRDSDIAAVQESLESGEDTIILTEPNAFSWLRAINHLRLAAAGVCGASHGTQAADQETAEFRMFMLLSWLEEEFVAALEA